MGEDGLQMSPEQARRAEIGRTIFRAIHPDSEVANANQDQKAIMSFDQFAIKGRENYILMAAQQRKRDDITRKQPVQDDAFYYRSVVNTIKIAQFLEMLQPGYSKLSLVEQQKLVPIKAYIEKNLDKLTTKFMLMPGLDENGRQLSPTEKFNLIITDNIQSNNTVDQEQQKRIEENDRNRSLEEDLAKERVEKLVEEVKDEKTPIQEEQQMSQENSLAEKEERTVAEEGSVKKPFQELMKTLVGDVTRNEFREASDMARSAVIAQARAQDTKSMDNKPMEDRGER